MSDRDVLDLPLPDADARARIVSDLDVNLLVEAGAGSGKTTELIRRMIALLETGTATVDEIAAVTFTRKAAAELRERFQTAVELRAAEARASGAPGELAAERLMSALDDIDRAFIGTIHAFCARLLRERPLEVGLDPAFEELALEERYEVRHRFWHAYLERLTRESDPVLEELARAGLRPAELYGLFDRLVENPDVDFPAEEAEAGSREELEAAKRELEAIVDEAWELMPEQVPPKGWDRLQQKLHTLHFTRDVTRWTEPADFYDALAAVCKPGPSGHRIVQNRWRERAMAVALRDRVDSFGVGDTPAQRLLGRWYAHRYALAIRLARAGAEEFAAHRRRIARLDFQDLLVLAADLLRANPRVRRSLGERYRRLLVDEFQDTDPLQAEIMMLLASKPEPDAGREESVSADLPVDDWRVAVPRPGALFVVGDPKQSIYRFRRADIQLYGVVKERFAAFGGVIELTTNFRSRPAIGDLVNELFGTDGFFPAVATEEQAAFEPLNTRPPTRPVAAEGVFTYAVTPSEANQAAAARDDASRIASWIRARVDEGGRQPGDFLILTKVRARIEIYARALEAHSLPVQVTGAGVGVEEEIRELEVLLRCMIDPSNSVQVVAALVGLFFGIDYERLVSHRQEGGGFDVVRPGHRGHPDVLDALRVLHGWWRAASTSPADVSISRLVSEIGLLPYAAAGDLGALRAGALMYAVDAVRAAALAGDASLPGALQALEAAMDLAEAEAPLEPGRPDVVRLMNLHQAKGLEAPVVILADPSAPKERTPEMHVARAEDGSAVGYVRVTEPTEGRSGDRVLAIPSGWDEREATESRFQTAEDVRLLYVAVTRAKEELLVVRWHDRPDSSPWKALHGWLDARATALELESAEPEPRARSEATVEEAARAAADAAQALQRMSVPTFLHRAVTEIAKADVERRSRGEGGAEPPASAGRMRGFSWGSAVHGALAAAARGPSEEQLRAACRDLLVEHGRPLDDHGEPVELRELIDLVRTVESSELWARAARANRMFAEIPFSAPGVPGEAVGNERPGGRAERSGRRQLELFGAEAPSEPEGAGPPEKAPAPREPLTVVEGVIDLAFKEPDGWVVADYKTDLGTDPDFRAREASYRRQVELYAEAWARLTGDPVKERVLFFTSQDRVESW